MRTLFAILLLLPVMSIGQNLPLISEKTKDMKKTQGFFNFYWEESTGKVWMEINKLDSEILYQVTLPAGLGSNDIGLDRGLLGPTRIVKFTRAGRKILLLQPNYSYRATSPNVNEQHAVEQSFAQSILWGFTAEAATENNYLVDITAFLLRDAMNIAGTLKIKHQGSYELDLSRSAIYLPHSKSFPLNTEMESTVTFVNKEGPVGEWVNTVTPSSEAITLRIHHSFVQLPDNNYQPRIFDPRMGYFNTSYYDYSSPISTPIAKYLICRHRLQKKVVTDSISEAVNPIVYYLDNGTPEPIRSALMEGASWWDKAFETAGFRNAFQVKMLPDGADPMDIRYNMINWVHRSTRGWSYGYSVVDPRTGEIIKGNVTLGSLRVRQDYLIAQGLLAPFGKDDTTDATMQKMALSRLSQLAAHEIGHTLGLLHNYSASMSNRSSVMDYPHALVRLDSQSRMDLSNAYDNNIGDWDKIAIQWGYRQFSKGTDEKESLQQLIRVAHTKGLFFLSDEDARPTGSVSPEAHLWDNGSNPVNELKEVMKIRARALSQFGENNIRTAEPMAMLEDVLVPIYFFHRYQLEATTKLVGGMYYRYALRGDGQVITKQLTKAEQVTALQAVLDCIDPGFLLLPDKIIQLIPPRPQGYLPSQELFNKRTGPAFDALAPAESAVHFSLSFLFNSDRLNRMEQFEVNGGLGVREMLSIIFNTTWKAARKKGMEKLIQQQTEQVLLTYLLACSIDQKLSFGARSDVKQAIKELNVFFDTAYKTNKDASYKAHLLEALDRMKKPEDARPALLKEIPPGAPIGCEDVRSVPLWK